LISFLSYYETLKKSKATQADIDALSEEIKENWWKENKKKAVTSLDSLL